jgi:hypothetical protein
MQDISIIEDLYRFTFTNRATKDEVVLDMADISTKINYSKFTFNGNVFSDYNTGLWSYEVVAINDDGDVISGVLESGFMNLIENTIFTPTGYDQQNNQFKVYNG